LANSYGFRAEAEIKERRVKGEERRSCSDDPVDHLPLDALDS